MPRPSRRPDRARRAVATHRALVFAGLCAVCLVVAIAYAGVAAFRTASVAPPADASADPDVLTAVMAQPHLVFLHSPAGDAYRRVAVVPLDDLAGQRYLTPLQCQRVYAAGTQGLCLGNNYLGGVVSSYNAYTFDDQFQVGHTYQEVGTPTRARLSPDGRFGATTVFVSGHSYADAGFSTQTLLVDTATGSPLSDMEQFSIFRDNALFRSSDFNFWGVTFASDSNRFYATLGSGGKTYLVEGDLAKRQARTLAENVECPSLSPDNTRLVFKKRVGDGRTWRLTLLDLTSMVETPLAAEARNVDDQVEWLDDGHVLYGLQEEGSLATDIWQVAVDGDTPPTLFLRQALSPAVVR